MELNILNWLGGLVSIIYLGFFLGYIIGKIPTH